MSVNSFHTSGSSPTTRCRVGLLGFGTVGAAFARRLTSSPPDASLNLELTHIFDRRAQAKRDTFVATHPSASRIVWTSCVEDVLGSEVDVVVEAIGGTDDAAAWTRAALLAGKSVVTCNKQMVARHGDALLRLAARQGRQLRFEGAVGGAMPIVRAVGEGLAGDRITRIVAILNGTTNAVLSSMESSGCSMAEALTHARASGYAEADPSADLDGADARAKLAILCALAFGLRVEPEQIETRSCVRITPRDCENARRRGATIRQIAYAAYDPASSELTAWVAPSPVPSRSLLGQTSGAQNAALVTGAFAGEIAITGAGAGGDATAVAILGDLLAVARDRAAIVPARRLSRPVRVIGLTTNAEPAEHILNAETAEHAELPETVFNAESAEIRSLRDLRDRCVEDRLGGLGVDRRIRAEVV